MLLYDAMLFMIIPIHDVKWTLISDLVFFIYSNDDTLIIPIIENLPSERDLTQRVTIAMQQYPMSNAVLIRRHGIYVWGESWQSAKSQYEN